MWSGRYTQFKPGWNIKMDFTVVRVLTSDHCGLGSNAGVWMPCVGWSCHWFLRYLLPTESFPWVLSGKLTLSPTQSGTHRLIFSASSSKLLSALRVNNKLQTTIFIIWEQRGKSQVVRVHFWDFGGALALLSLQSKFEFSFVAPIHFLQK